MVDLDRQKLLYLSQLKKIFQQHIPNQNNTNKKESLNFVNVAKVISHFYQLIPSYTRSYPSLTSLQKRLIAILDVFKQPETFILRELPQTYTGLDFYKLKSKQKTAFFKQLEKDIAQLFEMYIQLIKALSDKQKEALYQLDEISGSPTLSRSKAEAKNSLASSWKMVLKKFPDEVLSFPFSQKTLMFIHRILSINEEASNQLLVESLADALTGIHPKHWNERGQSLFDLNLQKAICEVEQVYHLKLYPELKHVTLMSSLDPSGQHIFSQIPKTSIDIRQHKKLINVIEKQMQHLSPEEKNSILLEIIHQTRQDHLTSKPSKITNKTSLGEAWG